MCFCFSSQLSFWWSRCEFLHICHFALMKLHQFLPVICRAAAVVTVQTFSLNAREALGIKCYWGVADSQTNCVERKCSEYVLNTTLGYRWWWWRWKFSSVFRPVFSLRGGNLLCLQEEKCWARPEDHRARRWNHHGLVTGPVHHTEEPMNGVMYWNIWMTGTKKSNKVFQHDNDQNFAELTEQ